MAGELTFEELALIAGGHSAFQLLWAGVDLNVFEVLSDQPGRGQAAIADAIGLALQPARILLTGLTALKLICKDEDGYRNSAIAERILVRGSDENMIDVLGWQAHIVYPGQIDFVESLRGYTNVGLRHFPGRENNLYQRIAHEPPLERAFHKAMSSLSRSANTLLASQVDFSKTRRLVDAGGGDGTNAIALALAHPHLHITVFDAPSVCERAQENIRLAGLEGRVDTYAGDLFKERFPPGIDCVLLAHMMTIWSLEKDTELLRSIHRTLPAGGRVIIFNMMGNDAEDGPLTTALGSPYFISVATGQGMLYSWQEYEMCLREAGFACSERQMLPRDHGVLIGSK